MPCLAEVMGACKPDRHALAPSQVRNKSRVNATGERGDALVAAEPDRGDDGIFELHVRYSRFNDPQNFTAADEGPFRAVALHDPEMVPCPAPVGFEEKFPPAPQEICRAFPKDLFYLRR